MNARCTKIYFSRLSTFFWNMYIAGYNFYFFTYQIYKREGDKIMFYLGLLIGALIGVITTSILSTNVYNKGYFDGFEEGRKVYGGRRKNTFPR